jgi:hypothetical protein
MKTTILILGLVFSLLLSCAIVKEKKEQTSKGLNKIASTVITFLVFAFIGALLDHFVWPGALDSIDKKIFGEPEIIVNINEVHPLENAQRLEDFALMFVTGRGIGMISAINKGHPDLNRMFGDTLIPTDIGRAGNNLEYNICIVNSGNRKAKDIKITFLGDQLKTDYKVDVDRRIDFVSCGGSGSQCICDIRKKELAPKDKVGLFVKARTPSITNVNINAKGNYSCFVNFRTFYARLIQKGESVQLFLDNNRVAELPRLNSDSNYKQYYYSPQTNEWILK